MAGRVIEDQLTKETAAALKHTCEVITMIVSYIFENVADLQYFLLGKKT